MLARRDLMALGCVAALLIASAGPALAQTRIRPGFNLFSVEQDQDIGRQSAAEAERQLPIIRDSTVDAFVTAVGARLAAAAPGAKYAYVVKVVDAPDINAFALPGGYIYLNRGLIEATTSEGQLAGVLGHEMAHIALRHGTTQASKAYLGQTGLGALAGLIGKDDASTRKTVDAVGGFGLNAAFLKFSRSDERQADVVGAQILARAGYDPMEMVEFFRMLNDTEDHSPSKVEKFFSSHPPPGDRAVRVKEELKSLKVATVRPVGGFEQVKSRLRSARGQSAVHPVAQGTEPTFRDVDGGIARGTAIERPASRFRTLEQRDHLFQIEAPENWRIHESANGYGVTIAPEGGLVDTGRAENELIHGVLVNHYDPFDGDVSDRFRSDDRRVGDSQAFGTRTSYVDGTGATTSRTSLARATSDLVNQIQRGNPDLQVVEGSERTETVSGQPALSLVLAGTSSITRLDERVTLFTRELRDDHVVYAVFVSPARDYEALRPTFSRMMSSLRVNDTTLHD